MEKEFFADKNWPFALQISGGFVGSPRDSVDVDWFTSYRFYHHFPSAMVEMLKLSSAMFEQELIPYGTKSPLYKDVAIIDTQTREELVSYLSLPLSSSIKTGEFAGLYLVFATTAKQTATKYGVPLDRLSHYDPGSVLLQVAAYDTGNKNIIRVDPKMDQVISTLSSQLLQEGKDTHQVHTAYHGQGGRYYLDISHHFNGLAAGMDGLFHHPLFTKTPTIHQTLAMIGSETMLRTANTEIASIQFEHYKGDDQTPPAGFHLSFKQDPRHLQEALGIDLNSLPGFHRLGKDHYLIALADGGRPVEVAAFTALRVKFHDKLLAEQKALKRKAPKKGKSLLPPQNNHRSI